MMSLAKDSSMTHRCVVIIGEVGVCVCLASGKKRETGDCGAVGGMQLPSSFLTDFLLSSADLPQLSLKQHVGLNCVTVFCIALVSVTHL